MQGCVVPGEPTGKMVDGAYFSPAPEDAKTTARAIVVFTDIFGLPLQNCKIIADALAARVGCDVWVPDLFNGAPSFLFLGFWRSQRRARRETAVHDG